MKIPRTDWHTYWMLQAHLVATRSTCDRGPELFFDKGRHGVGAVIVKDNMSIGTGYNGSPPGAHHCCDPDEFFMCRHCRGYKFTVSHGYEDVSCPICETSSGVVSCTGGHLMVDGHCVRTIHSEMNALLQCALSGTSPRGSKIYTTASPCYDCAKAIIRAGIVEVRYGMEYSSRYGMSNKVADLFSDSGIDVIFKPMDGVIK